MLIKTHSITTAFLLISVTAMAAGNAWAEGREGHDALRTTLSAPAVKQLKRTAPEPKAEIQSIKTLEAEDSLGAVKARLEKSRERAKAMRPFARLERNPEPVGWGGFDDPPGQPMFIYLLTGR